MSHSVTRRAFLRSCTAAATVAAAGPAIGRARAARRPNILFAVTDNQSWCHTSATGDPVVRTPGFDRVAAEGVLFEQAYAPSPSCTPSRSSILTGQDFWRLGPGGVLHGTLPNEYPLYTDLLREAGYHVGFTGKGWGPGRWDLGGRKSDPAGEAYNKAFVDDAPKGVFSADYAGNLAAFLDDAGEQPWCFWYGAKEPHRDFPEEPGAALARKMDDVPIPPFLPDNEVVRRDMLAYYREVEWQDRFLARMLELLEQRGELENTIVAVTSDNGIQMPRGIANCYDYGTRVPLAVRWGAECPAGRTATDFINLTNCAPTFLEAAGLPVPDAMTGRSLVPLLHADAGGQIDPTRDAVVTGIERHSLCRPGEVGYPMRMLRTKDYLYIRNYEPDRWPAGAPDYRAPAQGVYGDVDESPTKAWMIAHREDPDVAEQFALSFGKRPGEELYHLPADPAQMKSVNSENCQAEALAVLRGRLRDHLSATEDPRQQGESPWDRYPYYYVKALRFRDQFTNPYVLPGTG